MLRKRGSVSHAFSFGWTHLQPTKPTHWDVRTWPSGIRPVSAVVLLSFVICHRAAHCFLLVSFDSAQVALNILMYPRRTSTGTAILLTALLVHYFNALWSIYRRRSLRLPPWQWTQISLGLCIPMLLMLHVVGTRLAESVLDVHNNYKTVLIALWLALPWLGLAQAIAVLTVWTHACVGMHFWLRIKRWYPRWRPFLFAFGLLLPALALAGFLAAGNEVLRGAKNADYVRQSLQGSNLTAEKREEVFRLAEIGIAIHLALVGLTFAGRGSTELAGKSPTTTSSHACIGAHGSDISGRIGARDIAPEWNSSRGIVRG
jgi:hypothetical protein